MKKRIFSALLVLAMILTLLPAAASAEETPTEEKILDRLYSPTFRQNAQEKSQIYTGNIMAVTVRDPNASLDKYTITVIGPNGEPETEITRDGNYNVKFSSSAGIVSLIRWNYEVTKPGEYTIKVEPKDNYSPPSTQKSGNKIYKISDENEITLKIVKITFDAGAALGYGQLAEPDKATLFAVPEEYLSTVGTPKVNAQDGYTFVGWHTDASKDYSDKVPVYLDKVPDGQDGGDEVTLNAQYGATPKKEFKIKYDQTYVDTKVLDPTPADLGAMEVGDAEKTFQFTLENTGNQDYKQIYLNAIPSFLTYEWDGESPDDRSSGVKLPADGGKTATLKLKTTQSVSAGDHVGSVSLMADRTMYTFKVKLRVNRGKVTLSLTDKNFEKTYGEEFNPQRILEKVSVAWNGGIDKGSLPTTGELGLAVTSTGLNKDANANAEGYDITITPNTSEYEVTAADLSGGKLKVNRATPSPVNEPAVNVKVNTELTDDLLSGFTFRNPESGDPVEGVCRWTQRAVSGATQGTERHGYTFTPTDQDNYQECTGQVTVTVSEKDSPALAPESNAHTYTYDGGAKSVTFASGAGSKGAITVKYAKKTDGGSYEAEQAEAPTDAGTYKVTATIPETAQYAAGEATVELVIEPREVQVSCGAVRKEYDGDAGAAVTANITNRVGGDDVAVAASGTFDDKNAGADKNVTVTLTGLTGAKAGNYRLPAANTVHTTGTVTKKPVTLTKKDDTTLTKKYGEVMALDLDQFDAEGIIAGETLDGGYVVLECAGLSAAAAVGSYPITVVNHAGGNYEADMSGVNVTVQPATAKELYNSVRATSGKKGGSTGNVTITGTFVNQYNEEMRVPGTLTWEFADAVGGTFPKEQASVTAHWTFTPTDPNYTGTVTGDVTVTLLDKDPLAFNGLEAMVETVYNGRSQPLTGVSTDPEGSLTFAYKNHVDTDYQHGIEQGEAGSGDSYEDWNANAPTNAGLYDVRIIAIPSPAFQEEYAETSILVHLHITKAAPAVTVTNSVPEGAALGQVEYKSLGVNGEEVDGQITWDAGGDSVIHEGETYHWAFYPADGSNYGETSGQAGFTFRDDTRKIGAQVYNLPGETGNYAVVDVKASGLKAGEILTFYSDAQCTNPESASVPITDVNETALIVPLDADALSPAGGVIYAKVNKVKFHATEIGYDAEPGAELPDPLRLTVDQVYTPQLPAGVVEHGFEIADPDVVEVRDGKLVALKAGSTTITVTLAYPHPDADRHPGETFTVTTTITVNVAKKSTSPGGSGGSGGSGGTSGSGTVTNPDGSATTTTTKPDGSKTETTKHTDGTVTEKVTEKDGSATETTTTPDGVVGKTDTDKSGVMTSAQVTIPAAAAKEGAVTAPVEVDAAKDSKAAPEIDVKIDGGGSAKVEIPVTEFGPGTVAVLVHADGTEEIVRDCVIGENGVVLNVEGSATLKILDNTKTFSDVGPVNHWATGAVEFVAARELFNGTGDGKFTPGGDMTRGMLVTVLYRLNYEPETVGGDFADVSGSAYYADAVAWAQSAGVVNGYGSGAFGPDDDVSREQIVTILYRYAEKNGCLVGKTGSLSGYADADSVSGYAVEAMGWAIETGLVKGVDATHLAPTNNATRAEVATILMRFCEDVVK